MSESKNPSAKKTTKKLDIYDLYQKQMAKSEPSMHAPKIKQLIDVLTDIAAKKGESKDKETPKIKKSLIKLQEALDCFEIDSNKAFEGPNVDKIINGFAKWVSKQPSDKRIKELSEYVVNAGEFKNKSKKTAKNDTFNAEKEAPKVRAVLEGLKKKIVDWEDGLGKSDIIEKLGGPSAQLDAGKVSTCVAALVNAGKSSSQEAKALIKKVGTKYFPASN